MNISAPTTSTAPSPAVHQSPVGGAPAGRSAAPVGDNNSPYRAPPPPSSDGGGKRLTSSGAGHHALLERHTEKTSASEKEEGSQFDFAAPGAVAVRQMGEQGNSDDSGRGGSDKQAAAALASSASRQAQAEFLEACRSRGADPYEISLKGIRCVLHFVADVDAGLVPRGEFSGTVSQIKRTLTGIGVELPTSLMEMASLVKAAGGGMGRSIGGASTGTSMLVIPALLTPDANELSVAVKMRPVEPADYGRLFSAGQNARVSA